MSKLFLRKELFRKVHNFVHLNLAIALLLGYVVFLAGIDTAVVNEVQFYNYSSVDYDPLLWLTHF